MSRHPPSLVAIPLPSVTFCQQASSIASRLPTRRALSHHLACLLGSTLTADSIRASQKMQQWHVGPVPDFVYANSTHQSNDMQ